mgnify:CR=1 FL=1
MHQLIDKKNKVIIYLVFLFVLSTTNSKNIESEKDFSVVINKINVTGLSSNKNLEIINKLNKFFYKSIFIINKEEIKRIISEYNIVEEYSVKKIYPSVLNVDIRPTKFIAQIYDNNKILVGSNGKLIRSETISEKLPYIGGVFNSKEFLKFKKKINLSKFNFKEFKSLFFHPSKRWDILTVNDILIKLPEKNLSNSLNLAYNIIKDSQFKGSKIIDLRISNHLIIQ